MERAETLTYGAFKRFWDMVTTPLTLEQKQRLDKDMFKLASKRLKVPQMKKG